MFLFLSGALSCCAGCTTKKEFAYQLCSEHILLDHRPSCNLSAVGDGQPIHKNRAVNSEYLVHYGQNKISFKSRPHYAGGFTLKTHQMFSVHTTPEEFENGGFTLETHQMFSVHTTPEEFKNATITSHLRFVFHSGRKTSCLIIVASSFSKSFEFKMFSVHTKTQTAGRF